jgi:catalase
MAKPRLQRSAPLSMANTIKDTVSTRQVAILAADGVDGASVARLKQAIGTAGGQGKIVAPRLGTLSASGEQKFFIDFSLLTASSVLFDAVYVPGGQASIDALAQERDAIDFVAEAYRHCKAIAATDEGIDFLKLCPGFETLNGDASSASLAGVAIGRNARSGDWVDQFLGMIAQHRHWTRAGKNRRGRASGKDETRGRRAAR